MTGFEQKLKTRLKSDLPGIDAQKRMAPKLENVDRFQQIKESSSASGGVLILLYYHTDTLHLPLMVRTEYDGPHSGQISFPGGKMEPGDKDLIHTALRESHEELGIVSNRVEVLGQMTELFIGPSNFSVLPVVGFISERPDFTPDPREVKEVIEVPLDHLLHPDNTKVKPIKVGGNITLQAPYYDVYGHTVWGATAMMLSEFLSVFKDL